MKNIKTYEDFVNEEINLRKGLMGAALATSLMGGMTSCNKEDIKPSIEINQSYNKFEGNWTTGFQYQAGIGNTNHFSCKITFRNNGEYIISERVTNGVSYASLVKGKYEIKENYTYANNQGVGPVMIFYPYEGSGGNYLKMIELEKDHMYELQREPMSSEMQQVLGVESPNSLSSVFVPTIIITRQY